MTHKPESKASEIIDKYQSELNYLIDRPQILFNVAKTCAIICVQEIVNSYIVYKGMHDQEFFDNEVNFWTAVLSHLKAI